MLKLISFLCCLLFVNAAPVWAQSQSSEGVFERAQKEAAQEDLDKRARAGDVRGLVWGLSREDVEGFENDLDRLGRHENKTVYTTDDFGFDASVIYHFYEDQLFRADVEYETKRTIPQDYVDDYLNLQDKVSELFGEPANDEVLWRDNFYKNDPERWGLAVMMGSLRLRTTWSTPRSVITLDFRGSRMKSATKITYLSKTIIRDDERPSAVPR